MPSSFRSRQTKRKSPKAGLGRTEPAGDSEPVRSGPRARVAHRPAAPIRRRYPRLQLWLGLHDALQPRGRRWGPRAREEAESRARPGGAHLPRGPQSRPAQRRVAVGVEARHRGEGRGPGRGRGGEVERIRRGKRLSITIRWLLSHEERQRRGAHTSGDGGDQVQEEQSRVARRI
ncbi:hypothetical protein L7F22_018699 [Adiantum nelumboides]|nr:hypothetical protein [Adiantum nelumboides]